MKRLIEQQLYEKNDSQLLTPKAAVFTFEEDIQYSRLGLR